MEFGSTNIVSSMYGVDPPLGVLGWLNKINMIMKGSCIRIAHKRMAILAILVQNKRL